MPEHQHDETISVRFGGSFLAASECSFLGTDRNPEQRPSVGVDCHSWRQSDRSCFSPNAIDIATFLTAFRVVPIHLIDQSLQPMLMQAILEEIRL
jgi:hypothetical protein